MGVIGKTQVGTDHKSEKWFVITIDWKHVFILSNIGNRKIIILDYQAMISSVESSARQFNLKFEGHIQWRSFIGLLWSTESGLHS